MTKDDDPSTERSKIDLKLSAFNADGDLLSLLH